MTQRKWTSLLGALALAWGVSGAGWAGTEGRINGTVVDQAGNPIEGVLVTLEATEVDISRTTESNKKGKFTMTVLNAARNWTIRLEKEGFQIIEEPIDPQVGSTIKPSYALLVGPTITPEKLAELESRDKSAKLYNEGAVKFGGGEIDAAIDLFKESLVENPDQGLAHLALARIYAAKDDYPSALPYAERANELVPDEELTQVVLFDCLWGLGQNEKALPLLDQMIESGKALDKVAVRTFNAGVYEVKVPDFEAAKARFEKAMELDARLYQAHIPLAQIAINSGEGEAAVRHASSFLEEESDSSKGLSLLYQAHLVNGNETAAQEAFGRLSAADPELVVRTFFEEGVTHFNAGRNAQAAQAFQNVLRAAADHPHAHYYLGLTSASDGDIPKAREHLNRFLELAPDDPEAATARQMLAGLK